MNASDTIFSRISFESYSLADFLQNNIQASEKKIRDYFTNEFNMNYYRRKLFAQTLQFIATEPDD